jgi:predicted dehydrogenase
MSRFVPSAAIVGAGLMGSWHAHAIARLGGRITAVVDADAERAGRFARRWSGARVFSDVDALLDAGGSEPVHVCTPAATHIPFISAALSAGRHVLAEKPLAETAEETAALVRIAEARGRLLVPVHQFAFQSGFRALQRRLPRLGRIRHVDFRACSAGADVHDDAARAAVAADILPHALALFARLLPLSIATLRWRVLQPMAGEIRALAEADTLVAGLLVSLTGRPTAAGLSVIGECGTGHVDLFHGFHVFEAGDVSRSRKVLRPFTLAARTLAAAAANLVRRSLRREPAYPGLRELVHAFHRAAAGDVPSPISTEETLAVAVARDRILAGIRRPPAAGHGNAALTALAHLPVSG